MLTQKITLCGLEDLAGRVWESNHQLRVGRLPTSEIRFDNSRISRQHTEILFTGERWIVRDLGSTNGTFLNGVRLGAAEEVVHEGDILLFAEMCVRVAEIIAPSTIVKQLDDKIFIRNTSADLVDRVVDFSATQENQEDRTRTFEKLLHIGRNLADYRSLDAYLEAVLWQAAEITNASFGAIIIKETKGPCAVRAAISLSKDTGFQELLDMGLGEWGINHGGSLLCSVQLGESLSDDKTVGNASMIVGKLEADGRPIGLLCLARSPGQAPFEQADLCLGDALARSLASSIDSFERFAQSNRELLSQTLRALSNLAFLRNSHARGRASRVTQYSMFIADELALSDEYRHQLFIGTPLIDLGMFALPASLVNKGGALTHREKLQIRSHVIKGAELLETIPALKFLVPLVRNHHEHWDGSGYPDALQGESIPLLVRVVAVADALETMTNPTNDSDQMTLSLPQAFEEMERQSGTLYDPKCVNALLRARKPIEELFIERGTMLRTISREEMQDTLNECKLTVGSSRPR